MHISDYFLLPTLVTLISNAALILGAIPGFDVSHYQGSVNMAAQKSAGAGFVYIKATEGTTFIDDKFSDNYNAATNAGLIRGAYHFARPSSSSGTAQANYFLAHGGGWSGDGRTLPGALDLEASSTSTCYGLSTTAYTQWVRDFVNTYKATTGRPTVIYTTTNVWNTCTGSDTSFAATVPLWIARYASTVGALPAGWSYYTFWQFADSGKYPGDQDTFNGAATQLATFARG